MRYVNMLESEQARYILSRFDREVESPTDEQKEARDKLEWAINNANKLKAVFMGQIDMVAENDVRRYSLTLKAFWDEFDSGPSSMVH